jgi:peroxiredoxin
MKWRSLEETNSTADTRTLREQFAERKALIAHYVPAESQAVHERVVAELKAQRVSASALRPKADAPAFELPDQNGMSVSSASLLSQGRLVVCFIRGRWCPFCCGQMEAMNAVLPQIQKAQGSLVAVSPQTVSQSYFMADQHRLRFPLLSDAGNRVARKFGLVYRVPDYQQLLYRRVFVNLPFTNGDNTWELPIPATYVLDRDGTVLYGSAEEDYTERPEPTEILKALSS